MIADHAHHGEIVLTPVAKDEFRSATWFMPEVKFVRDSEGRVMGMILGGNCVCAAVRAGRSRSQGRISASP